MLNFMTIIVESMCDGYDDCENPGFIFLYTMIPRLKKIFIFLQVIKV